MPEPSAYLWVFVEEASAEAALNALIPKLLAFAANPPDWQIIAFQGKADMLKQMPGRLRGLRPMFQQGAQALILVDRDQEDCRTLKAKLETLCLGAGLTTKSQSPQSFHVVKRIIVEELEAWFFGDTQALVAAYPRLRPYVNAAKYRQPDAIAGGTWEALDKLLRDTKDHPGGLEKIRAAREIAAHMEPARNQSPSFQIFRSALLALAGVE